MDSTAASAAVELQRVWLVKETQVVVVECKRGCITMNQDQFPMNLVLYKIKMLQTVLTTSDVKETTAFSPLQTIVLDVNMGGSIAGPIATSSAAGSLTLNIGASAFGVSMRGDLGNRMRNLDNLSKTTGGLFGTNDLDAKERWGLNVSNMPAKTQLLMRFGPFLPKDGMYVLELKYWRILEQLSDSSFVLTPATIERPKAPAPAAPAPGSPGSMESVD